MEKSRKIWSKFSKNHGERLCLKLLFSSRPHALAEELVVFSEFIFGTWRKSKFRYSFPWVIFSGPIGNSEFIFRTRRNSNFRYSELGETQSSRYSVAISNISKIVYLPIEHATVSMRRLPAPRLRAWSDKQCSRKACIAASPG